jgi:Response regulators consisting of a CheY-like receiver domain and a winged-helix DNA-binding domain
VTDTVNILVIELDKVDEATWKEIIAFLSEKTKYQVMETSSSPAFSEKANRDILSFPGLEICVKEQTVCKDGVPVSLSHYEFFTLYYLAQHPGWVFTKEQIYEAVWQQPGEYCGVAVSNVISQIRKKLNPEDPKHGYIKTIVNSGYKFEP